MPEGNADRKVSFESGTLTVNKSKCQSSSAHTAAPIELWPKYYLSPGVLCLSSLDGCSPPCCSYSPSWPAPLPDRPSPLYPWMTLQKPGRRGGIPSARRKSSDRKRPAAKGGLPCRPLICRIGTGSNIPNGTRPASKRDLADCRRQPGSVELDEVSWSDISKAVVRSPNRRLRRWQTNESETTWRCRI